METSTGQLQPREVSSRYRSPTHTPVASSSPRRSPSPTVTRSAISNMSVSKRSISSERRRASCQSSPSSPPSSTPGKDTVAEHHLAPRSRLAESLWPSTMRSLNVSFQFDSCTISDGISDRTLRPSCNVGQKQNDTHPSSRKPTPERKRSPLKGKNSGNHSENSRPVEGFHSRLVEQHRWPSRTGGKVSSKVFNSSTVTDKADRMPCSSQSGNDILSLRRLSLDGLNKPSHKLATDLFGLKPGKSTSSADDNLVLVQRTNMSTLVERGKSLSHGARSQSLPVPGSRSASPNKGSVSNSSVSRGVSPSKAKTPSPVSSRGPSPSRSRPSSPLRQSSPPPSSSVLSFITDIRKGKKAASHIEDVHQLRLLYNRHLQWLYANAQVDVSQHAQSEKAEKTLYSAWRTTSDMWQSVVEKRKKVQQMRLYLQLCSVVNPQVRYLDEWADIERDHAESLRLAMRDLVASTLRLPLTGGAKGDTQSVKTAMCSALDVMLAMGSSIGVILSQIEKTNCLVSQVAQLAAQEKAMLDECEALLGSTVAMQVEEYSLRLHVILQSKEEEAWRSQ